MNKSHTDLGIEDQQLKLIFKKLFLIGDQLEKLNKTELNENEEIQDIVQTLDEIMETIIKHCKVPLVE
jgi:hypothetical protein